ncbi:MAG TPA: DUF2065 domain-containing protein [Casimicrobiaceae bacterium]|nr:DUF2065 domain-containing protein [Casimicrobiaceae bacterium]
MVQFFVAIGLVFVLEGLFFAVFPGPARRSAVAILETPEQTLRVIGVLSAAAGVLVIWLTKLFS